MGRYLFYAQLVLLVLSFYFGDINELLSNGLLTLPFAVGIVLGLWAFYNMGSKNYSPFPEPKSGGQFVQKGVYKYIRHPMYTGVILIAVALLLSNPSITAFIVFAALVYILDEKADLEEKLLTKQHSEYKNYQASTKKFIPFVY